MLQTAGFGCNRELHEILKTEQSSAFVHQIKFKLKPKVIQTDRIETLTKCE